MSLGGQPEEAFYGYPAPFGAAFNDTATAQMPLVAAQPATACEPLARATLPGAAALVARGNCSFAEKAKAVQAAGFEAMLLFNNDEGKGQAMAGGCRWRATLGFTGLQPWRNLEKQPITSCAVARTPRGCFAS